MNRRKHKLDITHNIDLPTDYPTARNALTALSPSHTNQTVPSNKTSQSNKTPTRVIIHSVNDITLIYRRNKMTDDQKHFEYLKLWSEQSKLFWSRLQTLTAFNVAVFAGWWSAKEIKNIAIGILVMGLIFNLSILVTILRDADYMEKLKKCSWSVFPDCPPKCCFLRARPWAYITIGSLACATFVLLGYSLSLPSSDSPNKKSLPEKIEVQHSPIDLQLKVSLGGKSQLELIQSPGESIRLQVEAKPLLVAVEDPLDSPQSTKLGESE